MVRIPTNSTKAGGRGASGHPELSASEPLRRRGFVGVGAVVRTLLILYVFPVCRCENQGRARLLRPWRYCTCRYPELRLCVPSFDRFCRDSRDTVWHWGKPKSCNAYARRAQRYNCIGLARGKPVRACLLSSAGNFDQKSGRHCLRYRPKNNDTSFRVTDELNCGDALLGSL